MNGIKPDANKPESLMPEWVTDVDVRFHMPPDKRVSLSIYGIVKEFKEYIEKEKKEFDDKTLEKVAKRIKILCNEKVKYAFTEDSDSIKEFFSVLQTASISGKFKNAGLLSSGSRLSNVQKAISSKLNEKLKLDPKFICD